uniref:Uncharacterized protein n=1 Tax=Rhizophora mucronata TaxID=61149 RepID=A0A2P2P9L6_RHIMU
MLVIPSWTLLGGGLLELTLKSSTERYAIGRSRHCAMVVV